MDKVSQIANRFRRSASYFPHLTSIFTPSFPLLAPSFAGVDDPAPALAAAATAAEAAVAAVPAATSSLPVTDFAASDLRGGIANAQSKYAGGKSVLWGDAGMGGWRC